jgi:hypothetical protein
MPSLNLAHSLILFTGFAHHAAPACVGGFMTPREKTHNNYPDEMTEEEKKAFVTRS